MTQVGVVVSVFAAIEHPLQGQNISKASGLLLSDVFLIGAIAVGLLLVLLFWARYLRNLKLRKPRTGGQRVYRDPAEGASPEEIEEETPETRRKYKYRYRRRDHRGRNPTLAETGGLPPERSEGSGEPTR